MKSVSLAAIAAAFLSTVGTAALAQMGDPSTMKCVEFMGQSEEGMGQITRAASEAMGTGNELSVPLLRRITTNCSANPEMTVLEAANKDD